MHPNQKLEHFFEKAQKICDQIVSLFFNLLIMFGSLQLAPTNYYNFPTSIGNVEARLLL